MAEDYRPWTWEIPDSDESIKSNMIPRQDAYERVSGKAVYTRDIYLPGMLYAKILTSPYAHAKIVSMDLSEAEALIGLRDILKFDEPDVANENNTGASPSNILTLPGIVHPIAGTVTGLTSDGKPDQTNYVMSRQAHFIEVEVDTETGQVDITNAVCVNDVGHCFNPAGAMGQQYGGAVMAFGRSATEEKVFCPNTGVGLNYDHMNYHIGTMNDFAPVHCILNESHLGYSAYGAYGIGENIGASLSGITSSAIYNAIGKWVLDYPTTPDKVLKALGKI